MTANQTFLRVDKQRQKFRALKIRVQEFVFTHWRVDGCVNYWPTKEKWHFMDGSAKGIGIDNLIFELGKRQSANHTLRYEV